MIPYKIKRNFKFKLGQKLVFDSNFLRSFEVLMSSATPYVLILCFHNVDDVKQMNSNC